MATNKSRSEPMTPYELKSVIGQQLQHARSYLSAEVASDRQANLRYYLNRPLGNEVDGRSQVISTDVQDTIESLMPDLVELFVASGNIWTFEPQGPEDVQFVEQVSDYIHDVVWNRDNPGFKIAHDAIKDTLLEKSGILKIWWDDTRPEKQEILQQVSMQDILRYEADPNVEILEAEPFMQGDMVTPFFNIKISRTQETGRCVIEVVPSEEFLVNTRTRELDETCSFCAHRRYTSRSELVEMGYDKNFVWDLPTIEGNNNANLDRSRVRHARFSDDRSALTDYGVQFESEREIEIYECYPLMDWKGEGISKRHLVRTAGFDGSILLPDVDTGELAVEIDDHPFVMMQGIRQTGRLFGRAVADLVRDIQKIKTTIQRQTLDNMYQINNQRSVISNKVDLDDFLNNDVGAGISVDDNTAVGHVVPMAPGSIIGDTIPLLNYWDETLRDRTGIVNGADPLDPKSFHATFGGANLMLGQLMKRLLFIARTMAETGFEDMGRKILRTVVNNQDAARTVRLRNKWMAVDPRRWNSELDVKVNVGLGHGTKETKLAGVMQIAEMQKEVIALVQNGQLSGPFVTANELRNTLDTACSSMSMDTDLYFRDVSPQESMMLAQPKPQEPSELAKIAQATMQLELQKVRAQAAMQQQKNQLELMKNRMDDRIDMLKLLEDRRQFDVSTVQDQEQHDDKFALDFSKLKAETGIETAKLVQTAQAAEQAQSDVDTDNAT